MTETKRRQRGNARADRRAKRERSTRASVPFITRRVPTFELASEEVLALIENNADTVLETIGIDFRDDPLALDLLKQAGASVDGERVRFPKWMCREIISSSAPAEFTQHARNPDRSVRIGGNHTVLVPAYGSPFVHDLDKGRRYATLGDFENFTRLAYMSPSLHHSGGTLCEPVDLPVNKRHLDMIYSHLRWSDKPFMGSVTHPDRAQDTVDMRRLHLGMTSWIRIVQLPALSMLIPQ